MIASLPTQKLTLAEALAAARETRALEMGRNNLADAPKLFRKFFPGKTAVLVTDTNTFQLAGKTVQDAFTAAGETVLAPFVFDDADLYAEYRFVEKLQAAMAKHEAIAVAVGSGTLNDLAKLASHQVGRPYMCVATAASMDGYTAFGASITYQGAKQTFNCPAPTAVLADLDIICAAPLAMTASGYADMMAKITAGADWILADALGAEAIDPKSWSIVQGRLREALSDPDGVRAGKFEAIAKLTEGLMLGGFAMQSAQSSRPASGAEHQFSHLWDMQHHTHNGYAPSHGFKVGIGTLAVADLYEKLFAFDLSRLDIAAAVTAWPDEAAGEKRIHGWFHEPDLIATGLKETKAKATGGAALRAQLEHFQQVWPELKSRLQQQMFSKAEIRQRLQAVGAPVDSTQIGITRERLAASHWRAWSIRRRFTILDAAARLGQLDRFTAEIYS